MNSSHTAAANATPIALTDLDRRIWAEEIDPVIPGRIFDIHAHVFLNKHIGPNSPERHLEVANRYGLPVTLQLSKRRGIADPDNIRDLEHLTDRYGAVKWILAHCARGFYP